MKKTISIALILAVALVLLLSSCASSNVSTSPAKDDVSMTVAASENMPDNAELVEEIKAFQKKHPEYKTAYHAILNQTDVILREEISKAFKSVQAEWREKTMEYEEKVGLPMKDRQRFAGLCETMAFIVNKDFIEHYKSVFVLDNPEYFDGKKEEKIVADYDEAYKAIAAGFNAFTAEIGNEKTKNMFTQINYSLSKAMDEAFDRANARLKVSFDEIAKAYGFSDEDKTFVRKVISGLMKDINANFMASSKSNKMEGFDPESAIK
jgi:ABC-type glycerol-3-phosphate transport system substrate-binding protein